MTFLLQIVQLLTSVFGTLLTSTAVWQFPTAS